MFKSIFPNALAMEVSLRPVCLPADVGLLYNIFVSTREDILNLDAWTDKEKDGFLQNQFLLQHRAYTGGYRCPEFMIIQVKGIDAGRLYMEHREKDIRIIDIAMLPLFRSHGAGSALMQDIFLLSGSGARSVSIHVEKSNPAMRWYRRMGFVKIEDADVYDLMERPPLCRNQPSNNCTI